MKTFSLEIDSREKFMAVWTALQQFVDNQEERDSGDEIPAEETAAIEMLEKL